MHMSMEIYPRTAAERAMKLQTLVRNPEAAISCRRRLGSHLPRGNINRGKGLTLRTSRT